MLTMLNTLMDISEAESGAMPLQREPVHVAEVASRAIDLYRDVADAKGVALTVEAGADVIVLGDRVRLEQVAANLIDNAVKYTPPGRPRHHRLAARGRTRRAPRSRHRCRYSRR